MCRSNLNPALHVRFGALRMRIALRAPCVCGYIKRPVFPVCNAHTSALQVMKKLVLLSVLFLAAKAAFKEDDDLESSDAGSGDFQYHELKWVTVNRNGGIRVADGAELKGLLEYIGRQGSAYSGVHYASAASMQMEDGPPKTDHTAQSSTAPDDHDQRLTPVLSTHFYPSYAVGLLENGCTAFMVGPQHALTAAHCVYSYNDTAWQRELNLWRGRSLDQYMQWMEWVHVSIPHEYFVSGSQSHDWALISFFDKTKSPVWLRLGYTDLVLVEEMPLALYGYLAKESQGAMYSTECHSDLDQPLSELLAIQCGTSQTFVEGGPVLQGVKSQLRGRRGGLKIPLVYGLSVRSSDHAAVRFHWDLFWTLCWLMEREGFESQCALLK